MGSSNGRDGFTVLELLVVIAIICVLAAILWPVVCGSKTRALVTECPLNVRHISTALGMYASDWDQRYPPRMRWVDRVYPYIRNRSVFICSADRDTFPGYGYSPAVASKHVDDIGPADEAVVVYDAKNGKLVERHNDGAYYGFAEGYAKWMKDPPPELLGQVGPSSND